MKKVLVLGAGHSAPYLIHHLLERASDYQARITVADANLEAAKKAVAGHERGEAIHLNVADELALRREIGAASIVVHLLPPRFQGLIAAECVRAGTHMVSASYRSKEVAELSDEAAERGLCLLCELGLDPGMDLMSAMAAIDRVERDGGIIEGCQSYGGGVPAVDSDPNPWRYVITWNPRNVVMAASTGAQYMKDGLIRLLPWQRVFRTTWAVDVPGLGTFEAYANRDSLHYRDLLRLDHARTLVRGTLRYPGWGELWDQLVRLGLPNEHLELPEPSDYTFRDLVAMFLPDGPASASVEERTASFLGIDPSSDVFGKLDWLGLFSSQTLEPHMTTPAKALAGLMQQRLTLSDQIRDMVVLHHIFDVHHPETDERQRILSTFAAYGEPGRFTAMAKSVGLTAALGVEMLLRGKVSTHGALIPTSRELYEPLLAELAQHGLGFNEEIRPAIVSLKS